MKREIVRTDDDQRMAVIRPSTELLARTAVAMAEVALKHNDNAVLQRIPAEIEEYVFVGFLARDLRSGRVSIVDEDGRFVSEVRMGDSFLGEKDLEASATKIEKGDQQ